MRTILLIAGLAAGVSTHSALAGPAERAQAAAIFERLTGVPLLATDARMDQMERLILAGNLQQAGMVAAEDPDFIETTVRNWASVYSTKAGDPLVDLDDMQAMMIGAVRDGMDARLLLTGDFTYVGRDGLNLPPRTATDNNHYVQLGNLPTGVKDNLMRVEPQWPNGLRDTAGVLTSRAWGLAHFNMGTNRRAFEYTFKNFLCAPIETIRDVSLPDYRIRRDVDRLPSGDPRTFQQQCRGCHAPMDGMAAAFNRFDFQNNQIVYYASGVAPKANQNSTTYPEGFAAIDDSWINLATRRHNERFGWKGAMQGKGIRSFARMVSEADMYRSCFVQRIYKEICRRDLDKKDADMAKALSDQFERGGFNLKELFVAVAVSRGCASTQGNN